MINAVWRDRKDIHQYILLYSGRGFSGAIINLCYCNEWLEVFWSLIDLAMKIFERAYPRPKLILSVVRGLSILLLDCILLQSSKQYSLLVQSDMLLCCFGVSCVTHSQSQCHKFTYCKKKIKSYTSIITSHQINPNIHNYETLQL